MKQEQFYFQGTILPKCSVDIANSKQEIVKKSEEKRRKNVPQFSKIYLLLNCSDTARMYLPKSYYRIRERQSHNFSM